MSVRTKSSSMKKTGKAEDDALRDLTGRAKAYAKRQRCELLPDEEATITNAYADGFSDGVKECKDLPALRRKILKGILEKLEKDLQ